MAKRGEYRLTRGQLFRALPKHILWAALLGLLGGAVLYFLKDVHPSGMWELLMFIPLAAVHVNMAVLPVAIPGRHWSFGYIGAMMLFFLLIAGTVLAGKFEFPHAHVAWGRTLEGVNVVTYWAILTGGLLGLLYGLIAGRTSAMILGLALGSLAGYALGIGFAEMFPKFKGAIGTQFPEGTFVEWRFSLIEGMGMVAVAMVVLHLASLTGAALGADKQNSR